MHYTWAVTLTLSASAHTQNYRYVWRTDCKASYVQISEYSHTVILQKVTHKDLEHKDTVIWLMLDLIEQTGLNVASCWQQFFSEGPCVSSMRIQCLYIWSMS